MRQKTKGSAIEDGVCAMERQYTLEMETKIPRPTTSPALFLKELTLPTAVVQTTQSPNEVRKALQCLDLFIFIYLFTYLLSFI